MIFSTRSRPGYAGSMNRHPYPFAGGALRNFIDGRFVEGPTRFANLDPVTGATLADVTAADRAPPFPR